MKHAEASTRLRRPVSAAPTLILTHADVADLLTMELAVPAVERAFLAHGSGEAEMPPKIYLPVERGDFRAMPGSMEGSAGLKWVNVHPENPSRHRLPAVMAVYILNDPETARPLAILDATLLTAFRTGAAGGVASKYLAKKHPRTIGFVGAGTQARALHAAHRIVFGDFESVAADAIPEVAERFAAEIGGRAGSIEDAAGCDIVCTATPSRSPLVPAGAVRPGAHVNAMGADAPGKQELDPALLAKACVVVDDLVQATHSGEVNVPIATGAFSEDRIYASLGDIVAGKKPGREGNEITVFDSTGLAVQDLALARVLYDEARRRGTGTAIDLVRS